jgi:hypothetical protein
METTSPTGIKAYILDNEAALWTSTHPRLYTGVNSCVDHLNKSIALAKTVRQMDANALIFGPESYGYTEYMNFQNASDWSAYSGNYSHYLAAYLDSMRQASTAYGSRLLDVFTVHWYPDVYAGSVYSSNTSPAIASERMQIPRSLWDSTYVENSWIGQWFSQDLPILPKLQSLIDTWYPGTKLGVTEYDYGGDEHISGGIAQVEALGAFAHTGTVYATKWDKFRDFSLSGIRLYRDVESPFGNQLIFSESSDRTNSSVFSSISDNDDSELHIITTNKNTGSLIQATFQITASDTYDSISVYFFTQNNPEIQSLQLSPALLDASGFSYVLEPLTAYHFVLRKSENTTGMQENKVENEQLFCYPNPAKQVLSVQLPPENTESLLVATSVTGQVVVSQIVPALSKLQTIATDQIDPGIYFLQHVTHDRIRQSVFIKG